jgi:hypothetical protein
VSGIHALVLRTNTPMPEAISFWISGLPHHRSGMDSRHSPFLSVTHEVGNDGVLLALPTIAENGEPPRFRALPE